ncbi:MAG: PEGA domain-containing protein [Deltaproteobacteria bacterium]
MRASVFIAAAIVAFGSRAHAARPSSAAVAIDVSGATAPGGPDRALELSRLSAMATQALLGSQQVTGIDAADRADARGAAARQAAQRRAQEKLKAARAAFDNLDLGNAIQLFGQAADAFRQADLRRLLGAYAEALLWQAGAGWVNGDKDGGSAELQEIFAFAPTAALDKSAFPPDLIEEAERVRADTAGSTETLKVKTTPVALVWVDGRLVGPSPVELKVPGGHHWIVASAPGFALATARTEGSNASVKLEPAPDAAWLAAETSRLARAFETKERTPLARGLADRLGVDELLVVAREPGALVVARFAQDGHVLAFERADFGPGQNSLAVAPGLLDRALRADLPRGAAGAPVTDTGLPRSFAFNLGRPQLAIGLGGLGIVALGVGTVFGILAANDHAALARTPQTNRPETTLLEGSGSSRAVVSDVFDIIGLLSAGAAAAVWYWPQAESKTSVEASPVSIVPSLGPTGGGLAVSGAF